MASPVKKEYVIPPVTLTDRDLAWISEKLVEVDGLYSYFDLTLAEWTVIQRNNPRDYAGVKRDTLLKWRKKKGSEATLANLVTVLASPSEENSKLIEEIIGHFNFKLAEGKCSHPVQESGGGEQPVGVDIEGANVVELPPTPSSMDIIYQLNPQMIKYINLVSLVPYLNKHGILTSDERFYLSSSHKSPTEKVNHLLDYLDSKGEDTVQKFLLALKEEKEHSGHTELCRLLKHNGVKM